jgi:hypothetical protein
MDRRFQRYNFQAGSYTNGAKIGIKIEKEGKWGKRKVRPFFDT